MAIYSAPAGIDDFKRSAKEAKLRAAWDARLRKMIGSALGGRYYGILEDTSGVPDPDPLGVAWDAFPRALSIWFNGIADPDPLTRAFRTADWPKTRTYYTKEGSKYVPLEIEYRQQDEYCEWRVDQRGSEIRSISFTCENPEYWTTVAETDKALLLELYRSILGTDEVKTDQLYWKKDVYARIGAGKYERAFKKNAYNPYNIWNTERGIVHLSHPSNSLGAEIFLAAQATWRYPKDGEAEPRDLLCCGGHGLVERASDPHIAGSVDALVRDGLSVALADPVGLYIQPFSFELLDREGKDVFQDCVQFVRASVDGRKVLRVDVRPPRDAKYTLDQLTIEDKPLRYGGQIARFMKVALFAVAKVIPGAEDRNEECNSFCCAHPKRQSYRAVFGKDEVGSCAKLPASAWTRYAPSEPPVNQRAAMRAWAEHAHEEAVDALAKPTRAAY